MQIYLCSTEWNQVVDMQEMSIYYLVSGVLLAQGLLCWEANDCS